jgi:hypothetical protein
MSDGKQRFEVAFENILSGLDPDHHSTAIVEALQVVAQELSELNAAASALMDVPVMLSTVIHHLEKIDAQTEESAEATRE